ncbi:MAG: UDP-N-acetylmuramoyl-L-alanine--D-glutamate ligase, partial [Desulfomonilaceae bacterium]|nr:UDP-N-acetylmuramoyl-L-alanine--D-glutamate ligase [Desulfomonilaceae bacterium]
MSDIASLFRGKRITVMGLGLLGRGLGDTLFLIRSGARVTVTDLKTEDELAPSVEKLNDLPVELHLGGHDPSDFAEADMILRNADVPRSSPFLAIAREHGVPIEMDESLFCKYFHGTVIGVTGTRGKTTTSTLIHRILSLHRPRVFLAGNIMGTATLPLLEGARADDTVVLELSSWQLQGFHDARISPQAAVFTNVYPDHLNRYRDMTDYIHDKKAIFLYQKGTDFCLFNEDQPECVALSKEAGARKAFFTRVDVPDDWRVLLPGTHNRENIAAAARLCTELEVPEETVRRAVEEFTGVEHRLQWLGEKDGVGFVNDSTSTTPVAGCAALKAFKGRRIFLIAGGSDKNLDLSPFAHAAAGRAEKIALLDGTATESLRRGIEQDGGATKLVGTFSDMKSAVEALMEHTATEDVVLLSPGCASFGMFQNEFHRGETF